MMVERRKKVHVKKCLPKKKKIAEKMKNHKLPTSLNCERQNQELYRNVGTAAEKLLVSQLKLYIK